MREFWEERQIFSDFHFSLAPLWHASAPDLLLVPRSEFDGPAAILLNKLGTRLHKVISWAFGLVFESRGRIDVACDAARTTA